jgi:hypothetical protein
MNLRSEESFSIEIDPTTRNYVGALANLHGVMAEESTVCTPFPELQNPAAWLYCPPWNGDHALLSRVHHHLKVLPLVTGDITSS